MIHLAIDIGASSGRHIVGWREQGQMQLQEVYRFSNLPQEEKGHLVWDLDNLCRHVVAGLKACAQQGIQPDSIGIDTWAVDYVLLDRDDKPIAPMYCYRDSRGSEAARLVHEKIPFPQLYARTGIQFQPFNTIYQMYWDKAHGRLEGAGDFLMLPEYLSFFLTGKKCHEYTNASTTGLVNARTKTWDMDIVRKLELPEHLFGEAPRQPPLRLGKLKEDIASQVGFSCLVVLPATHDTASAIAALPQDYAYLSSGTWSLLGAQLEGPITTSAAMGANFTNEGGVGTIRFLKNIMGLWLIQCLKRELENKYSFTQLAELAKEAQGFAYQLDVNHPRYLAPQSIMAEIAGECREKGYPIPATPGQYAHAICSSLAHAYHTALTELESITGRTFDSLCVVGGGVNNQYLNILTEKAIGRPVIAGAAEATALGNLIMQEAAYV